MVGNKLADHVARVSADMILTRGEISVLKETNLFSIWK